MSSNIGNKKETMCEGIKYDLVVISVADKKPQKVLIDFDNKKYLEYGQLNFSIPLYGNWSYARKDNGCVYSIEHDMSTGKWVTYQWFHKDGTAVTTSNAKKSPSNTNKGGSNSSGSSSNSDSGTSLIGGLASLIGAGAIWGVKKGVNAAVDYRHKVKAEKKARNARDRAQREHVSEVESNYGELPTYMKYYEKNDKKGTFLLLSFIAIYVVLAFWLLSVFINALTSFSLMLVLVSFIMFTAFFGILIYEDIIQLKKVNAGVKYAKENSFNDSDAYYFSEDEVKVLRAFKDNL